MSRITKNQSFIEIEQLLGPDAFGGYLMECKPETWATIGQANIAAFEQLYGTFQGNRVLAGLRLLEQLVEEGRTMAYDVYTPEEVAADPSKGVVRLFHMPGEAGAPWVMLTPGGAYQSVCSFQEGFPTAADLHAYGYNVFLLTYRTRFENVCEKPITLAFEDLARAVRFVLDRADEFALDPRYAVMGWSAGGHLAAEWGTANWGAAHWGLPQASMLMLGYPAIDFHTMIAGPEAADEDPFYGCILGTGRDMANVDEFAVNQHLGSAYPPTFIWQCKDDDVVPFENFRRMDAALDAAGVRHESVAYSQGGHGLQKPHYPEADRWIDAAIAFLDAVMGR